MLFIQVRVVLKYRHCDGNICMKVTDDAVVSRLFCLWSCVEDVYIHDVFFQCLQYKTDQAQDVKKIEKLHGKLMRLMVSKESHSGAMETDWMNQRNCWDWTVVCYWQWREMDLQQDEDDVWLMFFDCILRMFKSLLVWWASRKNILQEADFCVPVWRSDNIVMIIQLFSFGLPII